MKPLPSQVASDLSMKITKANSDIFTEVIHNELNKGLEVGNFHCTMKLSNITPAYKKGNRSEKDNYQLVSILPNISKDFEICSYKQIYQYFEGIITKYQCSFRKRHSVQHVLISLLEKWHYNVYQGSMFGGLVTDLSRLLIVYHAMSLLLS